MTGPAHEQRVTVAVLTYRRPHLLPVLLTDLGREAELAKAPARRIRVLLVDNDPAGSGRAGWAASVPGVPVDYLVEPRPGIAAARNRALRECRGEHVLVFLDDDERPDPGWLDHLLRTHARVAPAAVAGPVRTEYLGQTHPWAVAGRFVDRSHRVGLVTGDEVPEAATNNLLLDVPVVTDLGLAFDESLGLAAGEDSLFTRQLTRAGGRIVWCAEAWVTDLRPGDRTTRAALLRRAYSFATAAVGVRLRLAEDARARRRVRWSAVAAGSVRVAAGATSVVLGLLTRRVDRRANGARLLARGTGTVVGGLGGRHEEYARRR